MKSFIGALCIAGICSLAMVTEVAAQVGAREMGTGRIVEMGHYSGATGEGTAIWSLRSNPAIPFPADCPNLWLIPSTMGQSAYKTALNLLMLAGAMDRPVRFYAHATRPGGNGNACGVDYVEMKD